MSPADRGLKHRTTHLGDAGKRAGQLLGVDHLVGPLPRFGVQGELGLDRAKQPDLGRHLGGKIGERYRLVPRV